MSQHRLLPGGLSVVSGGAAASAASPLLTNLLAYYTMNEATAAVRADSVGENPLADTGSVTQGVALAANLVASAGFSGTGQYLTKDAPALALGDIDLFIAMWVSFGATSGTPAIVGQWKTDTDARGWLIGLDGVPRFRFGASSNGTAAGATFLTATTFGAITTGVPYFVMAWHDKTANTLNISINNGTVDSVAYSTGIFNATTAPLRVGANGSVTAATLMTGSVDDLFISGRILTVAERTQLYAGGLGLPYPF
jgi:hypothetical protein